jgi:hypothetical protein
MSFVFAKATAAIIHQKIQQIAYMIIIQPAPKHSAFARLGHNPSPNQMGDVMRKGRLWNIQMRLNILNRETIRASPHQKPECFQAMWATELSQTFRRKIYIHSLNVGAQKPLVNECSAIIELFN